MLMTAQQPTPSRVDRDATGQVEASSAVAVRDAWKSYPGVKALMSVDFSIQPGEVRALLGKNGAGKSTLVKILAGIVVPDSGEVLVGGNAVSLSSPNAARDQGIAIVNQELAIVPGLSVAENIYLGRWSQASGLRAFTSRRVLEEKAAAQLAELGVHLDPSMKAGRVSIAHQQIVEIARALSFRPKVLILDEPTSSLPAAEVDLLLALVRRLASRGMSIIYVSHRMDEIPKIANSVTILRDGRHIATQPVANLSTAEVVRLMIGSQEPDFVRRSKGPEERPVVLRVAGVSDGSKLADISFDLAKGEILGLAGLLGSGRTRLLRTIYGLAPLASGRIEVVGTPDRRGSPRGAIAAGLGFAPEDRKKEGLALNMSVANNLVMSCPSRITRGGFLAPHQEERIAQDSIEALFIKIADARQPVRTLSGGNQQKVVLGKCLNAGVKILLLDEPTRGVDIEAKNQIYELLRNLADDGMAIVIASSEIEELFIVCDRLLVMAQGRVVASRMVERTTVEEAMQLAMEGISL